MNNQQYLPLLQAIMQVQQQKNNTNDSQGNLIMLKDDAKEDSRNQAARNMTVPTDKNSIGNASAADKTFTH